MKKLITILALSGLAFGSYNYVSLKLNVTESPLVDEELPISTSQSEVILNADDYLTYVTDPSNGLIKEKQLGDFTFRLQYLTGEMNALRELKGEPVTKESFNSKLEGLSDYQYYNFSICKKDFQNELLMYELTSEAQYASRVEYFSFQAQRDIKLVEGQDTLDCELFHFERSFSMNPNLTFSLGFKRNKNRYLTKQFCFNDKIFKNGNVNISISRRDLLNVPQLKID